MKTDPALPTENRTGKVIPFIRPADAVDYTAGAPENFPVSAFPPALRTIGENMAQVYQTPVCLPLMSELAILSGAVGKSVQVTGAYKDKPTRLNLYVMPIAERGSGKGVIGETLCAPMTHRSRELADAHRQASAGKRAEIGLLKKQIMEMESHGSRVKGEKTPGHLALLTEKRQRFEALEADVERKVTLFVGDATSEALARDLADNNEALFTFSTEAGAAVKVALGKYSEKGDGDFDVLLSAYSGDAVRSSRVNNRKGLQLERPCLTLLWLVQGCVARRLLGGLEVIDRGVTARMLMFDSCARRELDNRQADGFLHAAPWAELINSILDRRLSADPTKEIVCTSDAKEVFSQFNDEGVNLERGPFADLPGELSRWRENAIKVAGLFALVEGLPEISAELAGRACTVVRWCAYNFLGLLHLGRAERKREEFDRFEKLLGQHGGEITVGKLAESNGITRPQVDALVAAFPDELEIVRRPQVAAGRPSQIVRLKNKSSKSS